MRPFGSLTQRDLTAPSSLAPLDIYERILREVRARHRTFVSKVILHPGKVCEMQIKKEKTTTRAGQYIFLNCPEVSYFQWHPFTLTSAPEEDYISVHIRKSLIPFVRLRSPANISLW